VPPHLWRLAGAVPAHELPLDAGEGDSRMRANVFEPAPPDEGGWSPVAWWWAC
jgi:hypothetical protein